MVPERFVSVADGVAEAVLRRVGDEGVAFGGVASDAVEHAERFRQVLMANIFAEDQNGAGRITVSIGVADAIKGDTPDFLMRRAANGLKVAKREGRNRVVEMSPDGPIWDAERRM